MHPVPQSTAHGMAFENKACRRDTECRQDAECRQAVFQSADGLGCSQQAAQCSALASAKLNVIHLQRSTTGFQQPRYPAVGGTAGDADSQQMSMQQQH
jgi:hypothetical protein